MERSKVKTKKCVTPKSEGVALVPDWSWPLLCRVCTLCAYGAVLVREVEHCLFEAKNLFLPESVLLQKRLELFSLGPPPKCWI